jgi:hypothetical protein
MSKLDERPGSWPSCRPWSRYSSASADPHIVRSCRIDGRSWVCHGDADDHANIDYGSGVLDALVALDLVRSGALSWFSGPLGVGMAERAVVRSRLRELIVTIVAGDRHAVHAAWNAAFPTSTPSVDGSGDWPWQPSDLADVLRNLYDVVTASMWVVCDERWPNEDELESLKKDALKLGGWRTARMTGAIVAAVVPNSRYKPFRAVSLHKALTRTLLHEIVDRPLAQPGRDPAQLMPAVATLLTARLLASQPDGAAAAFDQVIAALDSEPDGPNLAAAAARVFYRVYSGFTRAKVTDVEQVAVREMVAGFFANDVPRFAAAQRVLDQSASKEHRQQIDRAFLDGATRMFSTADGSTPTPGGIAELVDQARVRAERETGGPTFADDDAAAATAFLEVCAGLLPRVGLTRARAIALAKLAAFEALDHGEGQVSQRLTQIEWLFFDVSN